jgi:branched-chain amino acid transport system ATP-binding protein
MQGSARETGPALLGESLLAGYGKRQVLFDVSVRVNAREIVTIFGHNGAGKTTLLKVLFGMVAAWGGRVVFGGNDVTRLGPVDSVKAGMSLTLAARPVFRELTVRENLELGGFALRRTESERRDQAASILGMFPILGERERQRAGTLSGGQQRMLALGMALMADPKVMLLDEPSLGLAPVLAKEFLRNVRRLVDEKDISVLLVEQNVAAGLEISDRAYFLRSGRVILEESAEQAAERGDWWDLF